jgi:ring-1,2-phenylacetyl-CoA epoxidase subunit PaaB
MHDWPLWEVFLRTGNGAAYRHAGGLHAPDAALALQAARDVYTRRGEGVSIWVVPAAAIAASDPDARGELFAPLADKPFRHPSFYQVPAGIEGL